MTPDSSAAPAIAAAPFIPLCEPFMGGNELAYVGSCIEDNWVSSVGPFVDRFEAVLAELCGVGHAVATSTGTAALHVALIVAGVQPGDEVLTSTLTFIASANSIRYAGAWPVLVDADPATWQMDVGLVEAFLTQDCERRADGRLYNRRSGRPVGAIMPVHIHGDPVDMDRLTPLAEAWGLPVIEDSTEALGSRWRGRPLGAFGRLGCFSFNGNKLITTGGGGMIVTDDAALARRAKHLTTQARTSSAEYFHDEVGYNYRLTNMQAAMGVAQMEQLDRFIASKRAIAARYSTAFAQVPGITEQQRRPEADSNRWMYVIEVDPELAGIDARGLMAGLGERRIQGRPVWQPMHLGPVHGDCQVLGGAVAERIFDRCASLPCSVSLDEASQTRVIEAVLEIVRS